VGVYCPKVLDRLMPIEAEREARIAHRFGDETDFFHRRPPLTVAIKLKFQFRHAGIFHAWIAFGVRR